MMMYGDLWKTIAVCDIMTKAVLTIYAIETTLIKNR